MKSALAVTLLLALSAASASAQVPDATNPGMRPPPIGAPAYNRTPPTPAMMAARRAMRQACAPDVQKFCADAQTTGQRPMQCMRQHISELSPGCTQAIQAVRAARQVGGGPQG